MSTSVRGGFAPARKILLSINVRWWNAEAAYALNLARGLRDEGCEVWLVVNLDSPVHRKAEKYNIPVITDIRLDAVSPFSHFSNLRKILQLIDRLGIQVINSFKSNGSFLFSLARYFRPGLLYIKTRGEARPPHRNVMNRMLYGAGACDGLIAVGSPVEGWLSDLGLKNQQMAVIHYGDSPVMQRSEVERQKVRRDLNIDEGATVLTLLGRTQQVKGHHLLLEAMTCLKDDGCYLLLLVKDLEEFPEELRFIEDFITENNLGKQVLILGFQNDLGRILSTTDLGVIPSLDSEVNCRVAVEFFSLGVPVLAFQTGTLPDLIKHRENGYLTRKKDSADLIQGVQWLTAEKERLPQLGLEAQRHFDRFFTLEKMTRDTLAFYDRCRS
jgi:glycosyltransferase involved in cell wall biosynthesis